MKTFFRPSSIAVIGASAREDSLGGQIITNLLYGYKEAIYPVNPNYKEIKGLRCFPAVEAIPASVDMAIVIVPAPAVPAALAACGRKGIYRVIIESAGFSETGPEGRALQDKCTAIAHAAGIRVWGPNCMGLVDIPRQHFFTFMHPNIYKEGLIPGRISMVVQSGMLSAGFLVDLMSDRAIGIGKACSIGNKSDVDECDILEYLLDDDETDAIAFYLESIPRGRRFIELANQSPKPIVVLKGGRSSALEDNNRFWGLIGQFDKTAPAGNRFQVERYGIRLIVIKKIFQNIAFVHIRFITYGTGFPNTNCPITHQVDQETCR